MWNHLRTIYQQSNLVQEFELECNIVEYIQGDKNVRSFYAGLKLLWSEQDQILGQIISKVGLKEVLEERKKTRVVQFLMKLRPEFELIHGSLLNREVTLSLDVVLVAVLREEKRLRTQDAMESTPLPSIVLLVGKSTTIALTGNTKESVQCYECQDFGHITANCPKKKNICAYCKITGHHILDCCRHPNRSRIAHQAYQKNVTTLSGSFPAGHDLEKLIRDSIAATLPEDISSALSTSSLGTSNSIKSTWHLDLGAFNDMTGDLSQFSSFSSGVSKHVIHTENGHTLPTLGIGFAGNLCNVLYVPNLKANLVPVGQVVDQNCVAKFSPNGCVVQNLKIGMIMATGRRFGRIFLLESVHRHLHHCFLSISAADVTRSNKLLTLWHNRMGHPHSSRLHHMLKSCLPVAHHIHSNLLLAYTNCAGSKSHKLPFPSSSSTYKDPFDLVHSDVWGLSPILSRMGYKYFVLFIDHLESSEKPVDYDNGDLQPLSPSSTDPPLESPEQPMSNGNEAFQPVCLSVIVSTSSFSYLEDGSSLSVTPPRRSSRINRHSPKRLGGKFGKSYALHTTLHSVEVPTSYS
ncbi:hypothetical protein T459_26112 [Capsicum annuum]|uniref:CCHC-type domain-containing protein n=1 Tax=Capsicum annuum TaxID=4072 RepID=A0A2G2YMN7_CAPAN|nr:hypothetical protein T459_26112 [Capsicum annuum]